MTIVKNNDNPLLKNPSRTSYDFRVQILFLILAFFLRKISLISLYKMILKKQPSLPMLFPFCPSLSVYQNYHTRCHGKCLSNQYLKGWDRRIKNSRSAWPTKQDPVSNREINKNNKNNLNNKNPTHTQRPRSDSLWTLWEPLLSPSSVTLSIF
jgi:hypothetical protein